MTSIRNIEPNSDGSAMTKFNVGDRVEGGNTPEDYDTGTVLGVTGGVVLVAWDSGVRTSQPAELLRPEGSDPLINN